MRTLLRPAFALLLLTACPARPPLPPDDTTCRLAFSDSGEVRVFVVGHRFTVEDAVTYEAFEASYAEDMRAVAPCLSPDRPNLVLFPEDAGLIAWFGGPRAMLARGAADTLTAFNAMYAGWAPAADAYRARFPGISAARGLTLALGDVAWRAMDRTFGSIARRYGVHVITSANLPYVRREDAPLFRDPQAPAAELAYVATGPEVFNAALWYAPDGSLAGRVDKVFLTDIERDALDLTSGSLASLGVLELPFARVGAAISRDAFYPPFTQRLEDLGVALVVQPEAWSGWTLADPAAGGGWLPDVILASGWNHTQKYRGLESNATPMLNGNLFDLVFDGQVWLTRKATPQEEPRGFVGSRPLRGWHAIGPWSAEDPGVQRPGLSLEERQRQLREVGRALQPGGARAGQYQRTLVGADLTFHGEREAGPVHPVVSGDGLASWEVAPSTTGHQMNAEAAVDERGHLYVAFTDTRSGTPQVWLAVSEDAGQGWREAVAVAPSAARQLRPTVAATGQGQVVVAWQSEEGGRPATLQVASSSDGGRTFRTPVRAEEAAGAQWEPRLAFRPDGGALALAWMDFREGLAAKVRLARSTDGGHTWGPSGRVDAGGVAASRVEGMQAQVALAWTQEALAVAWTDYRARDWAVSAALAPGGGALGPASQVSPASSSEVLAADPVLTAGPDGTVVLAWEDLRERRGHRDVRLAHWSAAGGWRVRPALRGGADEGAFVSRFRPTVAWVDGALRAAFQDLTPGKSALFGVRVPLTGEAPAEPPVRLDDTGLSANQLTRPRLVATGDGGAVLLFEDDRSGWSRLRVSRWP